MVLGRDGVGVTELLRVGEDTAGAEGSGATGREEVSLSGAFAGGVSPDTVESITTSTICVLGTILTPVGLVTSSTTDTGGGFITS